MAKARESFDRIRSSVPGGGEEAQGPESAKGPELLEAPSKELSEIPPELPAKAPRRSKREEKEREDERPPEKEEPKAGPTSTGGEAVKKARANLLLAGIAPKAVKALEDDEILAQWGRIEHERRVRDEAMAERAELKKRLEALERPAKAEPKPEPTAALDLDSELRPLFDEIGVEPGSKAGQALKSALERATRPLSETIERLSQTIESNSKAALEASLRAQRARLGERNPRLKESDRSWQALAGVAERMAQEDSSRYGNFDELFDAAHLEVFGETEERSSDVGDENARKAASSPSAPRRRPASRELSGMEKAWRVFKHVRAHPEKSREEVKAYASRLGQG